MGPQGHMHGWVREQSVWWGELARPPPSVQEAAPPPSPLCSANAGHYPHSARLHINQSKIIICSLLACAVLINPNL